MEMLRALSPSTDVHLSMPSMDEMARSMRLIITPNSAARSSGSSPGSPTCRRGSRKSTSGRPLGSVVGRTRQSASVQMNLSSGVVQPSQSMPGLEDVQEHVLPFPGRKAHRGRYVAELVTAPDCRPTVAHPPKVMTHRPEGRAGPRSSRSRAGRPPPPQTDRPSPSRAAERFPNRRPVPLGATGGDPHAGTSTPRGPLLVGLESITERSIRRCLLLNRTDPQSWSTFIRHGSSGRRRATRMRRLGR
jgi:hypothetical protein